MLNLVKSVIFFGQFDCKIVLCNILNKILRFSSKNEQIDQLVLSHSLLIKTALKQFWIPQFNHFAT